MEIDIKTLWKYNYKLNNQFTQKFITSMLALLFCIILITIIVGDIDNLFAYLVFWFGFLIYRFSKKLLPVLMFIAIVNGYDTIVEFILTALEKI